MGDSTITTGRAGEDLAASWLEGRGYTILSRNWRVREGELDIVAERGDTVAFVEVKWRRDARFSAPGEAVNAKKRSRLRKTAALWMAEYGEKNARFDVIEMVAGPAGSDPRINHIIGAFV